LAVADILNAIAFAELARVAASDQYLQTMKSGTPVVAALRSVSTALVMLLALSAQATCSRPIKVPIASIGLSVITTGEAVSGVYPDVLRDQAFRQGCNFEFSVVPRARLEVMFEAGRADLLIPASRSARRDELGLFVPMIRSRAVIISTKSDRPPLRSVQDLLERRALRVALVRGFDFGEAYQSLVAELGRQGRVELHVDAASVARMLQAGGADLTIMAPSILVGAIMGESRTAGLLDKLRYEPLEELPWGDSGAYLSRTALNDGDRAALKDLLSHAVRAGTVWKAF